MNMNSIHLRQCVEEKFGSVTDRNRVGYDEYQDGEMWEKSCFNSLNDNEQNYGIQCLCGYNMESYEGDLEAMPENI